MQATRDGSPNRHHRPRRQRCRRSRRPARHDAARLARELARGARGSLRQARVWLQAADGALRRVENAAWQVRHFAEAGSSFGRCDPSAEAEGAEEAQALVDRYRRVASTALRLGEIFFGYRWHQLRAPFISRERAARDLRSLHERSARSFYQASVTHGGAFLKLGQLLSARRDLLPEVWIRQLSQLQDDLPPVGLSHVERAIERELGPIRERFSQIDATPVAAASIGQVHRAVTKDGQAVAVKVQRPGVRERIAADLSVLELFADSMRGLIPVTDLDTLLEELRDMLTAETDYERERATMAQISAFFAEHPTITAPEPVDALSGPSVLCSRFMPGTKITCVLDELSAARAAGDTQAGQRLDEILGHLLEAYVRMVLEAGIFQADPHPGNLLVTEDDHLVVLDFGAARRLTEEHRRGYGELLVAFLSGDRETLLRNLELLGFRTRSGRPDTLLRFAEAMMAEMREAVARGTAFQWPSQRELLERTAGLLRQAEADPVTRIPAEFILIGRVFATLGGIFAHYRPSAAVMARILPVLLAARRAEGGGLADT